MRVTRHAPFWWAENEAVDTYLPLVGPTAFALYCVLCRMANQEGE